jgi:hypothetical protein
VRRAKCQVNCGAWTWTESATPRFATQNFPKLRAPGPKNCGPRREPRNGCRSSHARRSMVHVPRTEARRNATGHSRPHVPPNRSCQTSDRRRTRFQAWKSHHSPGSERSLRRNGRREDPMPGARHNLPPAAQPSHRGSLLRPSGSPRHLHGNRHRRLGETRLHRHHGSRHHRPCDHRRRAGQTRARPKGQTKLRMLIWEVLRLASTC